MLKYGGGGAEHTASSTLTCHYYKEANLASRDMMLWRILLPSTVSRIDDNQVYQNDTQLYRILD